MDNLADFNSSSYSNMWQKVLGYFDSDERWHNPRRPRARIPHTSTHHRLIKFQSTTPELLFRRKVALEEYRCIRGSLFKLTR